MATEFAPHTMTSNVSPAPYVVSASPAFNAAYFAFDGASTVSYFLFSSPSGGTLKIDLGPFTARTLYSYSILVNSVPEPARAPKDFTLQGSNDNSTWTTLDTRTNETTWTSGQTRTYVCNSPTAVYYRYFQLVVTANNGDASYTQVCELYLQSNDAAYQPEISPRNMTTNSAPSPYVASAQSSLTAGGEYIPYSVAAGYWLSTNPVAWHKLDIGAGTEKTLFGYIIQVNSVPEPNRAPKDWTFEGSNNNSTWDVLDTRTNETAWGSGEWRAYTCLTPTATAYRYYRLNITANNGDGTYTQLNRAFLYAQAPASAVRQSPTAAQVIA